MQKLKLIALSSFLALGAVAGIAAAQGGDHADKAGRGERHAKMLEKFDTNKDGKLDDTEKAAMKKEMTAARFKKLDKNSDGVLSLEEFSAMSGRHHGKRH